MKFNKPTICQTLREVKRSNSFQEAYCLITELTAVIKEQVIMAVMMMIHGHRYQRQLYQLSTA